MPCNGAEGQSRQPQNKTEPDEKFGQADKESFFGVCCSFSCRVRISQVQQRV
jgi:hypothetical protein